MPGLFRKLKNYLDDTERWLAAGKPVVSPEVKAERRGHCLICPHRDPEKDACKLCGCPLYPTILGDKLERATSFCPDNPPRWLAMMDLEAEVKEEEIPAERRVVVWVDDLLQVTYGDVARMGARDVVLASIAIEGGKLVRQQRQVGSLVEGSGMHRVVRDVVLLGTKADVRFGLLHIKDGKPVAVTALAG